MKLDTDRVVSMTAMIVGLGSLGERWRVTSDSVVPQPL
jgi:hypothetical protein